MTKRNQKFKITALNDGNNNNGDCNNNSKPFVPSQYYETQQQQQHYNYPPLSQTSAVAHPPQHGQFLVPPTLQPAAVVVSAHPVLVQQQTQAFVPQPFVPTALPTSSQPVVVTADSMVPQQPAYNPQYTHHQSPSYQQQQQQQQPYVVVPTASIRSFNPTMSSLPPQEALRPPPTSVSNTSYWFDHYDRDRSGTLSRDEIIYGIIETFSIPLGSNRHNDISNTINSIWSVFDTDQSGSIEKHEFCASGGFGESLQQAMMTQKIQSLSSTQYYHSPASSTTTATPVMPSVVTPQPYVSMPLTTQNFAPPPMSQLSSSSSWNCSKCTFTNSENDQYCTMCQSIRVGGGSEITNNTTAPYHPSMETIATATVRVAIPQGCSVGNQVKVRTPDGGTKVVTIPDRSKWTYLSSGQPAFEIQISTPQPAATAIPQVKPSQKTGTKTVRVVIPQGYHAVAWSNPGNKVKVPIPGGGTKVVTIPDRSKWIYLNTGQPTFDIQVPVQPEVVGWGTQSSPSSTTSSVPLRGKSTRA